MEGWDVKSLSEVLKLEYGKPLPKEDRDDDGDFPAYGSNGIKCRTNKFYFDKPSIIVGRKGSAGEINYSEERFWPLDVTYYTKFDKNELNLDFLYHSPLLLFLKIMLNKLLSSSNHVLSVIFRYSLLCSFVKNSVFGYDFLAQGYI